LFGLKSRRKAVRRTERSLKHWPCISMSRPLALILFPAFPQSKKFLKYCCKDKRSPGRPRLRPAFGGTTAGKDFLVELFNMYIVCVDLESILTPEVWINVADRMKIKELRLTTRDVPDYDVLMKRRLKILKSHNVKLKDVQKIIEKMEPLKGALAFLNWLRKRCQVIVLSDTFTEFGNILMRKLGYPTLFCNYLEVDKSGFIKNYRLRKREGKMKAIEALRSLGFKVIAIGDSYNDITMLKGADVGFLFKASDKVRKEFPRFPDAQSYGELKSLLEKYI